MKRFNNIRIALFAMCVFAVFGLQGLALSSKILEIEPALYKERAHDLKVTSEQRYGYAWILRGAVLVKTANDGLSFPEEHKAISLSKKSLKGTMERELYLIPWKTILELAFYIALLWYSFFVSRWLRTKFHVAEKSYSLQLCFSAVVWMVFWTVAYLPHGLFGYGEPWHADAIGPGALSYESSPFLVFAGNALTISYRYFINILTVNPLMIGTVLDYGLKYLPSIRDHILYNMWLLGLLVYGMGGVIYAFIKNNWSHCSIREKIIALTILFTIVLILSCFKAWIWPVLPETVKAKLSAYDRSYEWACDKYLADMNLYTENKMKKGKGCQIPLPVNSSESKRLREREGNATE